MRVFDIMSAMKLKRRDFLRAAAASAAACAFPNLRSSAASPGGKVNAECQPGTGTVTDKKTKKKTKVYYKPTCQAVVIPATAPDPEEFEGEVYLFFAPSAGNNFPGYVATIPL